MVSLVSCRESQFTEVVVIGLQYSRLVLVWRPRFNVLRLGALGIFDEEIQSKLSQLCNDTIMAENNAVAAQFRSVCDTWTCDITSSLISRVMQDFEVFHKFRYSDINSFYAAKLFFLFK